ncbi:MAG: hypothetical protein LBM98_03680 [Oscillospiraceae bacterium]|nr:hypothetical protein [Oscillospiraceae bacterium]
MDGGTGGTTPQPPSYPPKPPSLEGGSRLSGGGCVPSSKLPSLIFDI